MSEIARRENKPAKYWPPALEDRIEAARESLKPLPDLKEIHRSEGRSPIGVRIAIAQAKGDFSAIARLEGVLWDYDRSRE
jgi:hypothetical protein